MHVPAAVVVASNRAAAGVYDDLTGPLLVEFLRSLEFAVGDPVVVPDGAPVGAAISAAVADGARVVLTTGGTGLTPTDRTPEQTRALLDFEVPGIGEAIRAYGAAKGIPAAALSRGTAGVIGSCLVVNLPGFEGRGEGRPRGARADPRARRRADRRERSLSPAPGWPATLRHGEVTVRPLKYGDANAWRAARRANADWLKPWDATVPPGGGDRPATFRALVRRLDRTARSGACMPFAIDVNGRFAGQITVNNIVRGSAQFASVGYWLDRGFAGRGVMPVAVALVIDHCFTAAGLHRIEIAIRPENSNSLRVVEKLGLAEYGYAPRFLHIDGHWRDHRLYAVTTEECPGGLLRRLLEPQ